MGLHNWDREAAAISRELLAADKNLSTSMDDTVKEFAKYKGQLQRHQMTISENLEKLIYLAKPNELLNPQETSLLHWASDFSEKLQMFSKDFEGVATIRMWSQLIHFRLTGNQQNPQKPLLGFGSSVSHFKEQQKRIKKVEKEVKVTMKFLAEQKEDLTEKYNQLVLARANRDAAGCLQVQLGEDQSEAFSNPGINALERLVLNASLRVRRQPKNPYQQENKKFSNLASKCPKSPKKNAGIPNQKHKSKSKRSLVKNSRNPNKDLKSFDNLADRLLDETAAQEALKAKVQAVQVSKSNFDASEITLSVPNRKYRRRGLMQLQEPPIQKV